MREIICSIKNLRKVYKKGNILANDGINLELYQGEIFGIFGPNGAGKTTLIKQLVGLVKPTSGELFLKDMSINKEPKIIPKYISYCGQMSMILRGHTVFEAIYFTGIFRGLKRRESKKETNFIISKLNLIEVKNRYVDSISGGQRRLVNVATTIIGYRSIIILDEPTNDLDPVNRKKVWDFLNEINHEKKNTIILVTHNILEAEQVVERVAIIDKGKIIALGTPGELKSIVDKRVRIELNLKDNSDKENILLLLSKYGNVNLKKNKLQVLVHKNKMLNIFNDIVRSIKFDSLDDFRLLTTTLEDVYINMGGSENGIE